MVVLAGGIAAGKAADKINRHLFTKLVDMAENLRNYLLVKFDQRVNSLSRDTGRVVMRRW